MAFTAQQKLDVKKHLELPPGANVLDDLFLTLADGSTLETNVTTAITAANTALTNLQTAQTSADEIVEGEGAKFSYERMIAVKRQSYKEAVKDLARLFSWQDYPDSGIIGFFNS